MESNPKLKPKLRLKLDQEEPSRKRKKKRIWKKIEDFISNGLKRRISGEWKGKDWGEW